MGKRQSQIPYYVYMLTLLLNIRLNDDIPNLSTFYNLLIVFILFRKLLSESNEKHFDKSLLTLFLVEALGE